MTAKYIKEQPETTAIELRPGSRPAVRRRRGASTARWSGCAARAARAARAALRRVRWPAPADRDDTQVEHAPGIAKEGAAMRHDAQRDLDHEHGRMAWSSASNAGPHARIAAGEVSSPRMTALMMIRARMPLCTSGLTSQLCSRVGVVRQGAGWVTRRDSEGALGNSRRPDCAMPRPGQYGRGRRCAGVAACAVRRHRGNCASRAAKRQRSPRQLSRRRKHRIRVEHRPIDADPLHREPALGDDRHRAAGTATTAQAMNSSSET